MILAQADLSTVPPAFLRYLLIAFVVAIMVSVAIGGLIFTALQYFQSRRAANEPQSRTISPDPLRVEGVQQMALEAVCKERHDLASAQLEKLRDERKKDVGELHEKINKVDKEVGGLTTATHLQNQTLAQISTKMDRLIERNLGSPRISHREHES